MKLKFSIINRYLKKTRQKVVKSPLVNLAFSSSKSIPDVIVTLSYSQIYSDFRTANPKEFLKGIPTFEALAFILNYESRVHYTLHATSEEHAIISDVCQYFQESEQDKIDKILKKHKMVTFINNEGTLRFVRLAMSCFEEESEGYHLDTNAVHNILKAYLYCNQLWTNEQSFLASAWKNYNAVDVSLKIDLPFSEFKFYKDFRTQLYKSIKLFEFAEKDHDVFSKILPIFCKKKNVSNWKEYIKILFGFFEPSLNAAIVDMSTAPEQAMEFMKPFIIDPVVDLADLEKDNLHGEIPSFYRDKFLLQSKLSIHRVLILSTDLLVDKFYQGLKFEFGKIAGEYGIKDNKGHEVNQKRINLSLGSDFSEDKLLYSMLDLIYGADKDVVLKSGSTTKPYFIDYGGSEPDYYWRKGNNLVLFENKDVLYPAFLKSSSNLLKQKTSISSKLARYGQYRQGNNNKSKKRYKKEKEGVGQIFYNIYRLACDPKIYQQFDTDVINVDKIYPVLIVYDKTYSALGVNAFVCKRVSGIKKRLSKDFKEKYGKTIQLKKYNVQSPIIIDIDTIIMYSLELKNNSLDLISLLDEYNSITSNPEHNLSSFFTFITDKHRLAPQGEEFIRSLYGDLLDSGADGD